MSLRINPLNQANTRAVFRLLRRFEEAPFRPLMVNRWRPVALGLDRCMGLLGLRGWGWPALHAVSDGPDVLAVSWIVRDSMTLPRWRIEQLVVAPETLDSALVGTQLIHYLINHYGAQGAQTFVAQVDHQFDLALGLLKACGFRQVARRHVYRVAARVWLEQAAPEASDWQWQEVTTPYTRRGYRLFQQWMPSELHATLMPSLVDWLGQRVSQRIQQAFSSQWHRSWVIRDPHHPDELLASVSLRQDSPGEYQLSLWCPLHAAGQMVPVILSQCCQQVLKAADDPTLTLSVYEHETVLHQLLEGGSAQWQTVIEVLEKAYWQRVSPSTDFSQALRKPILLLTGSRTSPA